MNVTSMLAVARSIAVPLGRQADQTRLTLGVTCLILAACFPLAASAQLSLQVQAKGGKRLGDAFFVTTEGLVATSFSVVEGAVKARLVLPDEQYCDVAGFVAASRAHDVVILAVKKLPKGLGDLEIKLAGDVSLEPGDELKPRFGPLHTLHPEELSVPIHAIPALKVAQQMNGPMLQLGRQPRTTILTGHLFSTEWYVLDRGFDSSAAGAPLWDANDNRIQGMFTSHTGSDNCVRTMLPITHVVNLLPPGKKIDIQPLSGLLRWEDPIAPLPARKGQVEGQMENSRSLSSRLARRQMQLQEIEQSIAENLQIAAQATAKLPPIQLAVSERERQIAEIQRAPEVKYTAEGPVARRLGPSTDSEKPGTGQELPVNKIEVRYRLSDRQQAIVSKLQAELAKEYPPLVRSTLTLQLAQEFTLPHARRSQVRLQDELFLLADPMELHTVEEHRALLPELDEIIDQRGAPAEYYLARGLCKLRLRQLDAAEADLIEAGELDVDAWLTPVIELAKARHQLLSGDSSAAIEVQQKAKRGVKHAHQRDGKLSFLLARLELDQDNVVAATRHLEAALAAGLDPVETHLALAWVYAAPPQDKGANGRQAVAHAKAACTLTGHTDWASLLALAAAQARQKDFPAAAAALSRAMQLAPPEQADQCSAWQAAIAAKKPLQREW